MSNKYEECFEAARLSYLAQQPRPGYPNGYFTWFRHPLKKNNAMNELANQLGSLEDSQTAQLLIESHFQTSAKIHNHSFDAYFLDELLRKYPEENWQQYNPKPIVFYLDRKLFRGTPISPEIIFQQGFIDFNPSTSLDDYVSDCNGSVGVSTTKDEKIAQAYAVPPITARMLDVYVRPIASQGYVYEIDYRGCEAVDNEATQKKRGNTIRAALAANKMEVNIIGNILREDIVGVKKYQRDFSGSKLLSYERNPNYNPNRSLEKQPRSKLLLVDRDFPLQMHEDWQILTASMGPVFSTV